MHHKIRVYVQSIIFFLQHINKILNEGLSQNGKMRSLFQENTVVSSGVPRIIERWGGGTFSFPYDSKL